MTTRILSFAIVLSLLSGTAFGVQSTRKRRHRRTRHTASMVTGTAAVARVTAARYARGAPSQTTVIAGQPALIRGGPWTEPTFADSTAGDNVDGEDLEVRRAAVEALGPYNGSVVAVDPSTGRILSMVNQRLALSSGFQPCSTIKVSVALAALSERLVTANSKLRLYGRYSTNLTQALAHSNNNYFATLGTELGFEKVSHYAHLFGYGEKAGLDIPGEKPGRFPSAPPKNGGVGMLTSFGEEISQTPLQLAALMSALANGGTLYYLQIPRTQEELNDFKPQVKRQLEISDLIPEIMPGMRGAVQFGTARRAQQDEPIAGKTGTCTDSHTHLGWFGSFNDAGRNKLVLVVLLTGGRPSVGPRAAGVAGEIYKRLEEKSYFATSRTVIPASLISTQICCSR